MGKAEIPVPISIKQDPIVIVPAQVIFLLILVGLPFLSSKYELLWGSILVSTLAIPAWVKWGPKTTKGLLSGTLCLVGMLLLVPAFAFWAILGVVSLMD